MSPPRVWYDPHFDAAPLWQGVEVNVEMPDYVWGQLSRDIDVTQGLSAFDRPVLLALGRYDFAEAPPAAWDRLRPQLRNLTVRLFERSRHTPPHEESELFDAEPLRWLGDHE
jgi:proline iminopeptidase